jgi:hypothetical protein
VLVGGPDLTPLRGLALSSAGQYAVVRVTAAQSAVLAEHFPLHTVIGDDTTDVEIFATLVDDLAAGADDRLRFHDAYATAEALFS